MTKYCTILLLMFLGSLNTRAQLPDLPWAKEVGAKKFPVSKKYFTLIVSGRNRIPSRSIPALFRKPLMPVRKPEAAL
ncbi:hypothetical protein [Niabella hibiscisoli]|uniref:hypothetical protein n=1 Tax=Niabella hibiscisoli TaxID=1825928 RepID=UPI001F0F08DB|nr:hypothetical protein [Niabella hibiscisoli]MCH5718345.1 hypothetical protein [Niabella hibiscisoli]